MADTVQGFSAMLKAALGDRIDARADRFVDMLAEDAVMEFPFAPPNLAASLNGRAAVARHLERLSDVIAFDRMGEPQVHATADPNVTVVEFEGFGRAVATGDAYDQRYISVIRTGGGRIVHYRDYWNPLVVLKAMQGATLFEADGGDSNRG